jgi:uncharacterized membrane protein
MRKIIASIVLIFAILLFIPLIIISWNYSFGYFGIPNPFVRDYVLSHNSVSIDISSQGYVNITDNISYSFKGCFREVYKEPNINRIKNNLNPYLIDISASCIPSCTVVDRGYEIAGSFGHICNQDASFTVHQNVGNGIFIGSDVSEFHYKIWGDYWDRALQKLEGKINLPKGLSIEEKDIYFNPKGVVENFYIQDNVINFEAGRFDSYLEVRLLMPKDYFSKESAVINPSLNRKKVEYIQDSYSLRYYLWQIIITLIIVFSLLFSIFLPIHLYKKYGTEPNINYNALYEREPIPNQKPYFINWIVGQGRCDKNVIPGTLLDLIRRKYIFLEEKKIPIKFTINGLFKSKTKKGIVLIFNSNMSGLTSLSPPEKKVYDYFKSHSVDGALIWTDLEKKLKKEKDAKEYLRFVSSFKSSISREYSLSDYFIKKGDTLWRVFCSMMFFPAVFMIFVGIHIIDVFGMKILFYLSYIYFFYGIIGLIIPSYVFGRFTTKGYEIYLKSLNFKKFMTDLTLLKKYPPSSIIIWEEQLVYAVIFGVANKVINNMNIVATQKIKMDKKSHMHIIAQSSFISSVSSLQSKASSTVSSNSRGGGFSGGGSVGGGFGGGGGGAR